MSRIVQPHFGPVFAEVPTALTVAAVLVGVGLLGALVWWKFLRDANRNERHRPKKAWKAAKK